MEGTGRCLIWGNIPAFSWRDCEVMKNMSESSRCSSRDSNSTSPEYKPEELSLEPTKSTGTAASVYTHHSVTNLRVIITHNRTKYLAKLPHLFNLRKGIHVAESVEGTATHQQPEKYRGWKNRGLTMILLYWVVNTDMEVDGEGWQPPIAPSTQASTGFIVHSQSPRT